MFRAQQQAGEVMKTTGGETVILDGLLILSDIPSDGVGFFQVLSNAYQQSIRRVVMLDAARSRQAEAGLRSFNQLLASRGLPQMMMRRGAPTKAAEARIKRARDEAIEVAPRRSLLRGMGQAPAPTSGSAALAELQAIRAKAPDALFAAVPVIDAKTCTGCDACLQICPREVLTQINDSKGDTYYHIDPPACDACGLCEDLCLFGAIRLATMVNAPADIPLTTWVCSACGVPARAPKVQRREPGLCDICKTNGQHKKLFQVLS